MVDGNPVVSSSPIQNKSEDSPGLSPFPYIGCVIAVLTDEGIVYEGQLGNVNTVDSVLVLHNAISYKKDSGRDTAKKRTIFKEIEFQSSEIKDLTVCQLRKFDASKDSSGNKVDGSAIHIPIVDEKVQLQESRVGVGSELRSVGKDGSKHRGSQSLLHVIDESGGRVRKKKPASMISRDEKISQKSNLTDNSQLKSYSTLASGSTNINDSTSHSHDNKYKKTADYDSSAISSPVKVGAISADTPEGKSLGLWVNHDENQRNTKFKSPRKNPLDTNRVHSKTNDHHFDSSNSRNSGRFRNMDQASGHGTKKAASYGDDISKQNLQRTFDKERSFDKAGRVYYRWEIKQPLSDFNFDEVKLTFDKESILNDLKKTILKTNSGTSSFFDSFQQEDVPIEHRRGLSLNHKEKVGQGRNLRGRQEPKTEAREKQPGKYWQKANSHNTK